MKRTLSLLLGLSLFGAASVVAQEAKKDAPKKDAPKKAAAPAVKLPVQPADVAAPKLGNDGQVNPGFAKSHEAFLAIAKKGEAQVVFLGDSITAGWAGNGKEVFKEYAKYNAANFGIGGDRVQHVLWRVENGEFDGIKPKAVVLMIGTNNAGVADNSPEQIAAGIKNIIDAIHKRSPETKVLLLAIFPRGPNSADANRVKNEKVNAIIAKLDDGKKVHFFDIGAKFLKPDGTLEKSVMPDLLHLNAASYQVEADAIREKLASLVK
ncbi:MAG: GDSL-type esterase/lipase family protein [Opitutales bacterium]